ncbi:MAG: proprotein convertase P-domain-containing protein [Sandaracinaceae bacterium]|nr:proprotein convertase P-domain-containing protein [Sandaracinaceae bacterium]
MAIPDNSATGVTSEATVPAGTTGTVTVAVNVTHTYSGDLSLVLSHGSQTWKLRDQTGGGADNIVTTFPLTPAPTGNLAGSWSLKVVDHAGQDVGTLNSWSLTFAQ